MDSRLGPTSTVIEFGSGWSSPWLAQRCARFITFETKLKWVNQIGPELHKLPNKPQIKFVPSRMLGFVRTVDNILRSHKYAADLVLVDCREDLRYAAARLGWEFLHPGGVLIFDDAQRPDMKEAVDWVDSTAVGKPKAFRWQEGDSESAKERLALAWQK
jgi:predicted O-methyltransferase YrrM